MWDATGKGTAGRLGVGTGRDEGTVGEVGMKPGQGSAVDAEPGRETVEEDGMVNGIKSSRKVKEAKASDLLFADSSDDEVMEREED